eukprot:TRINITY_DN6259_c0_g1_i2.p1 TRINITY_DN6259_c0_g1~~TRINITY_DN6259_c0_g1_i2.p1  ORF type:complete len:112 (-),score=0.99 TRINITY_DN6259_c0_g1_i2:193-528(-)
MSQVVWAKYPETKIYGEKFRLQGQELNGGDDSDKDDESKEKIVKKQKTGDTEIDQCCMRFSSNRPGTSNIIYLLDGALFLVSKNYNEQLVCLLFMTYKGVCDNVQGFDWNH